jgi:hypothetical protein
LSIDNYCTTKTITVSLVWHPLLIITLQREKIETNLFESPYEAISTENNLPMFRIVNNELLNLEGVSEGEFEYE